MLNGVPSVPKSERIQTLIVPVLGLSSMIQPIASSSPGTKNGSVIRISSVPRNGVSVRVTIQARPAARATAITVLVPIRTTVVRNTR